MLWEKFRARLRLLYLALLEQWRRVGYILNWRLVRGLGQLQILTRASYILLVIVPLLAALWPAVRIVVNQHQQAVTESARLLRSAGEDLNRIFEKSKAGIPSPDEKSSNADGSPSLRAIQLIDELRAQTLRISELGEHYASDYGERVVKTPLLPWSLAAAFFAALFVVLGHLVFQLAAPEPVRLFTWEDFIANRKEDYAKHPTTDALLRAREFVQTRLGRQLAESERYEAEETLRGMYGSLEEDRKRRERTLRELSKEKLMTLLDWIESKRSPAPPDYQEEVRLRIQQILGEAPTEVISDGKDTAISTQEMTAIERGARAEYLRLAGRNPLGTIVAVLLYAMAVWLIMIVIKVQAVSVITAAGWRSAGELFFH